MSLPIDSVFSPMLIMEAIHSTAMEHTHGPGGCDVCAAAAGDRDALLRVFTAVAATSLGASRA